MDRGREEGKEEIESMQRNAKLISFIRSFRVDS